MSNYMMRAVPVEAEQFILDEWPLPDYVADMTDPYSLKTDYVFKDHKNNTHLVEHRDWIIVFPNGERYLIPDEEFQARYQRLDDAK